MSESSESDYEMITKEQLEEFLKRESKHEPSDNVPMFDFSTACPDVDLSSADASLLVPFGTIDSVNEKVAVIQGSQSSSICDNGTVLFLSDGSGVGCVEDVIGQLEAPMYVVRTFESMQVDMVHEGTIVMSHPAFSVTVVPDEASDDDADSTVEVFHS